MQEQWQIVDWLVAGLGAVVAWFAKVMHARQNTLEQRLNSVTENTQQIVGRETAELRRVIDRNHNQVINLLIHVKHPDQEL
jgi:hypothetical protein